MRDDDHDALLVPQGFNRADECILAVGIEIGVWLVEDNQKGTAEYGPRQTNSLPLSGRQ